MRGTEWVILGILVTFVLLLACTTFLPPTSQFGIPVNPDITVVIDEPIVPMEKGILKSSYKDAILNELSKPPPTMSRRTVTNQIDTQVAKLKKRMVKASSLLDDVTHHANELRQLLSHHSDIRPHSLHAHEEGYCLPITQIVIEDVTPYLRSPAWYETKDPALLLDRSHLHLLASHYNPNTALRKIYVDMGASTFEASVGWMHANYPLAFNEIYAFEVQFNRFIIPPRSEIGDLLYDSIYFQQVSVGIKDDPTRNQLNFPKWMKEVLTPSADDFVVLKMDVGGNEWEILAHIEQMGLHSLVDELFVTIHYNHPDMSSRGWADKYTDHTQADAVALLRHWRSLGVYAHYWP